ncbi:hypothetical protein [Paenibacillus sp. 1_12]|uniref:hypothetical protein n=1 Tax=Paenibacillus sp. 1_12 TaxID=1566278 RepID=UPI00210E213E|nr:hypothetical protein [Paenibacillus sp. 1_12]
MLLASIAAEETALALILTAEGEKIQSIIGTLPGQTLNNPTLTELLEINASVNKTINNVIKKEMLLLFKLCDVIKII